MSMHNKLLRLGAGAAALAAVALAGAAVAVAGGGHHAGAGPARTPETPLTGDTLAKASAAAIAKVGGTVDLATTENDGGNAFAAYEVHVTKADGTHVTVILDTSFAVLSIETGGPRGPRNGETPLTGDVATKAIAAAVAQVGGTADLATTETDSSNAPPPRTRCT
jgi:uncharacterized membrane protein YkoI